MQILNGHSRHSRYSFKCQWHVVFSESWDCVSFYFLTSVHFVLRSVKYLQSLLSEKYPFSYIWFYLKQFITLHQLYSCYSHCLIVWMYSIRPKSWGCSKCTLQTMTVTILFLSFISVKMLLIGSVVDCEPACTCSLKFTNILWH